MERSKEAVSAEPVLTKDPRVSACLRGIRKRLRAEGVLPPLVVWSEEIKNASAVNTDATNPRAAWDQDRLKRLEAEKATIKTEFMGLRSHLKRYASMDSMLTEILEVMT